MDMGPYMYGARVVTIPVGTTYSTSSLHEPVDRAMRRAQVRIMSARTVEGYPAIVIKYQPHPESQENTEAMVVFSKDGRTYEEIVDRSGQLQNYLYGKFSQDWEYGMYICDLQDLYDRHPGLKTAIEPEHHQ